MTDLYEKSGKLKQTDYDQKVLYTINLYKHDIPFIKREKKDEKAKGFTLHKFEDFKNFIDDNGDLIKMLLSEGDDIIKIGGEFAQDKQNMRVATSTLLNEILNDVVKGKGFNFDDWNKKDFYNKPLDEFKKLF